MKNSLKLEYCKYPTATETHLHGLQSLPSRLPRARTPINSEGLTIAANLNTKQLQEMVKVVADSFAQREPMTRHLANKGIYSKEELLAAFITGCILTKEDATIQSLAIVRNGHVVGGAFNETLANDTATDVPTEGILAEALGFLSPIFELLGAQHTEAIPYLIGSIDGFKKALAEKHVGHHFMIARGNEINGDDAFSLVAGTVAHYKKLGFEFMITEATNAWTGAAMEKLNGIRVHFAPYRVRIYPGISSDGYLSDKDSGSMLYIVRI